MKFKQMLRAVPFLASIKIKIYSLIGCDDPDRGVSLVNILKTFPQFKPCSAGSYKSRAQLAIKGINGLFESFDFLIESLGKRPASPGAELCLPEQFSLKYNSHSSAEALKKLFDFHGSDKATVHNYHFIYASILGNGKQVKRILEIGLGTNNMDVVSNMGKYGKPGASLKAFRDFCPSALVIGADIDSRILFSDDRIETFYVDQTSVESLGLLQSKICGEVDLLIDDGLHLPNANINTIALGVNVVKPGGWIIIEDIGIDALPIWEVVRQIMQLNSWHCIIFKARFSLVFAARKPPQSL